MGKKTYLKISSGITRRMTSKPGRRTLKYRTYSSKNVLRELGIKQY